MLWGKRGYWGDIFYVSDRQLQPILSQISTALESNIPDTKLLSSLMVDNPAISDANLVVMIHIHRVIRNSVTKSPLHSRQQKTVLTRLISLTGFFTARLQQKCKCFVFVAASWWRSGFDNIQMTNSQRVLWPWQTRHFIKSKSSTCNRDVKKAKNKWSIKL